MANSFCLQILLGKQNAVNIALATRRNRFKTARLDFMEAQFVHILDSVKDQMAQVIRDKIPGIRHAGVLRQDGRSPHLTAA